MKIKYCYKCKQEQPFLDDDEYEVVFQAIKQLNESDIDFYNKLKPLKDAMQHRLSDLGPDCQDCGKPLRTPRARFCAECGWKNS